jgi:hypothetical protein
MCIRRISVTRILEVLNMTVIVMITGLHCTVQLPTIISILYVTWLKMVHVFLLLLDYRKRHPFSVVTKPFLVINNVSNI